MDYVDDRQEQYNDNAKERDLDADAHGLWSVRLEMNE
jgi:hypothetical protein